MTCWRQSILLILFTGVVSLVPVFVCAGRVEVQEVEVGVAGQFKLGRWTPVRITIAAADSAWSGSLKISARDGDDEWVTQSGGNLENISLSAGASEQIETYVRVGRQNSMLRITALEGDTGDAITEYVPVPQARLASQHSVLVIGADIGARAAIRIIPRELNQEIVSAGADEVAQLPSQWFGYESFDLVVLTTSDASFYDDLTDEQTAAIHQWVNLGGRVILTVGANGQEYLGVETAISKFAPGEFQRPVPMRDVSALESYADSTFATEDGNARLPPLAARLANVQGEVVLAQGRDLPLVIRTAHGLGQVIFVALDLDTSPIADWKDRNRLVAKILELALSETPPGESHQSSSGEASHLGFNDLSGQVTAALQVFEGVTLLNFSTVAILIVAYILLVGPLDFWLVRSVLKRPELTWVTSTLFIIAFCGVAWWLAGRIRGDSPRMNKIDIVDIDTTTNLARGTSWLHVYSPQSRKFELALKPTNVPIDGSPNMLLSWQGTPGQSMGGMNRDSRSDSGGAEYLLVNASDTEKQVDYSIEQLSLPAAGAKALAARWWATTKTIDDFEFQQIEGNRLVGHVENPLPVALTNCGLYHDRWVYQLGNLAPGQRVDLTVDNSPRDSEWALTERRFVEAREYASPWDQAMRDDVPKIMRMMMFHEVAKGRNHTNLLHRQYGYIDMSQHLRLDRAILVGMAEEPAAQVTAGGEPLEFSGDKQWTFYRIVYPIVPLK